MNAMTAIERVRLTEDLPELDLHPGEVGVVRGAWPYPNDAYEVEFDVRQGPRRQVRLLLLQHQIEWD